MMRTAPATVGIALLLSAPGGNGLALRVDADRRHAVVSGTIRGRIEVPPVNMSTDRRPDVGALGIAPAHDVPDRRRSVVYLDPAPRAAFDTRDEPHARMDQRNESFVPHVLPIVAGTTVDFLNNDKHLPQRLLPVEGEVVRPGQYAAGRSKPSASTNPASSASSAKSIRT